MGNKNVVLWDGTTVSVPEETASAINPAHARPEKAGEAGVREQVAYDDENTSGVRAAIEGFVDTASGGLYGKAVGWLGQPGQAHDMRAAGTAHPGARLAGSIPALFTPGGAPNALAKVGARTGSKHAARIIEGAGMGVIEKVTASNVTGDELTIAGTMEAAGIGMLLDFGIGALGDKALNAGNRAKSKLATEAAENEVRATAEGASVLKDHEGYTRFKGAHDTAVRGAKGYNAKAKAAELKRAAAVHDTGIRKGVDQLKKARLQVQAEAQATPYGRAVSKAKSQHRAAERAHVEATEAFEEFIADPNAINLAYRQVDDVIERLAKRPGGGKEVAEKAAKGKPATQGRAATGGSSDDLMANLTAMKAQADAGADVLHGAPGGDFPGTSQGEFTGGVRRAAPGDHPTPGGLADEGGDFPRSSGTPGDHPAPVGSPDSPAPSPGQPLAARLKEFRRRRHEASVNPDKAAGAAELRALRDDIEKQFPTGSEIRGKGKASALPDVPVHPGERPVFTQPDPNLPLDQADELDKLAAVSKDLDASAREATQLAKHGKYDEAADVMDAAKQRAVAAGRGDLEFPRFPPRAPLPVTIPHATLPDSLEAFARKTDAQVDELAQAIEGMPAQVGESFTAMAQDLALETSGTIGDTVRSVHAALKKYPAALDRMKSLDALKGPRHKAGLIDKLRDFGKRGARMSAGRMVDDGSTKGAFYRAIVGGSVGYALDGAEGAYLGGALMSGRLGVRSKLTALVAKVGPGLGRGLQRLAPVTAYLGAKWPSMEDDDDGDIRQLAHNRIGDVMTAAQVSPDAVYTAIEGILGAADDVAFKIHETVQKAVHYLAATAPKDPGLDVSISGSNWRPSHAQSLEFAYRIEAVENPMLAIERSIRGDGHPAATETLWAVWAPLMMEFAGEFMMAGPRDMGLEAEARLASLLRVQTGLQHPAVLSSLQALHLPRPTPPQSAGASKATGGQPGRPTDTGRVAGSSVSALIG